MRFVVCFTFLFLCNPYLAYPQARQSNADSLRHVFRINYAQEGEIKELLNFISHDTNRELFFEREKLMQTFLEICQKEETHKKYIAEVYSATGHLYLSKQNFKPALEYLAKAEELFEKQHDKKGLFYCWNTIVSICYANHDISWSDKYAKKAIQYAIDKQMDKEMYREMANLHGVLGFMHRRAKRYKEASECFEKGLEIAIAHKDEVWIGIMSGNLASSQFELGLYQEALAGLEKDIEISQKYKMYDSALNAWGLKLKIFTKLSDMPQAENTVLEMLRLIKNQNINILHTTYHLLTCEALAEYYLLKQDFAPAHKYHKKTIEIYKEREENFKKNEVAKIQAQYEFEKQEKLIDSKNKEIENQIIFFYLWTGISLSLLAGLVVFMLSFQKVKQQKRIISSQNQVKDKMFSVIGHDLRNPIANILAILELFEKGYVTEAELKENIYKLKNQTTNLQNTMHNLLLWATSQMKGDKQHIESLNIAENITEVVDFYDSVAKQKNIQLLTSVETTQKVQADQNQLHAILRNLISNAIKFTPSGGKVTATAKAGEAGKVLIRIQDTGVGMTYEETQKLFNLPTHFSKVGTNKEKGTGLGLLLVKEFVEANKGTIRVLSTPQKGTTFEITLPA